MNFNKQQKQAIEFYKGACAVVANPGSGKCVKGDTLVLTDKGIIPIEKIPLNYEVNQDKCEASVYSLDILKTQFNKNKTSHWYNMGKSKTIRITTNQGFEIEGTPEHPIVVLDKKGDFVFKKLKDIHKKDIVIMNRNSNMWGNDRIVSEDLAYVIGLLIGDGYIASKTGEIKFSNVDPYLQNKYIELFKRSFSNLKLNFIVKERISGNRKKADVILHNVKVKNELYKKYGLKMSTAEFKEIPHTIMMSPKNVVIRCLQGLFDTDGSFNESKGNIEYCSKSKKLIKQIQTLLLNLGIVSRVKARVLKQYPDNVYYYLYIGSTNAKLFKEIVNFRYAMKKKQKIDSYFQNHSSLNDNIHLFYRQGERLKRIRSKMIGKPYYDSHSMKLYDKDNDTQLTFGHYVYERRKLTKQSINKILHIIDFDDEDTKYLKFLCDYIFMDTIKNIEESEAVVYDFTVPDTHSFVANGFINHNTTVLTYRLNTLITKHGVPEKDILTITFTRNTADELKQKLNNMGFSSVNVGTFHSICGRILTNEGYNLSGNNLIKEWQIKKCFNPINDKADIQDIISFISYQKNYLRSYDDEFVPKESMYDESDLRQFFRAYETYKQQNGLFDFDDYLIECYKVLQNNPKKYTYDFVLVDEHQDSNLVQNLLLKEWCASGNIFAVFDFKQALYRFRGANPEYCMNFDKEWDNATIIHLDTNYRSAANIVHKANHFIKKYYGDYIHYSDSIPHKEHNGQITLDSYISREHEALYVADKIANLIDNGEKLGEIAVLYRNNSHAGNIENELKRRNIDYEISNDSSFFKRKEIEGILAYLRLLVNPHDDQAFETIFKFRNYPLTYFSGQLFDEIKVFAGKNNLSYYESFIMFNYPKAWQEKNMEQFKDNITRLNLQKDKGIDVKTLIDNVIKAFKIEDYIYDKYMNYEEREDRLKSLEILKSFVRGTNLEKFLSYVMYTGGKKKSKKNSVKLMTIHASKGLEFKHVFLIGVEDGSFPHENSELLDEARLFYVGVTRAKENLYISEIGKGNQFINEYFG
ncbi:3'-5' exonuclease [Bacillus smithii]|uniref:3'-5' exonuclease n=1 Tax=Bacillus smithii TaxID=1479 RepID=UPI003D25070F